MPLRINNPRLDCSHVLHSGLSVLTSREGPTAGALGATVGCKILVSLRSRVSRVKTGHLGRNDLDINASARLSRVRQRAL
jgi:hypothetical protein